LDIAVLSGAESYDSIELFGKMNIDFLKQFLKLKNGIPSHDTINRVFQALKPLEKSHYSDQHVNLQTR